MGPRKLGKGLCERELKEDVLPIAIHRPTPKKRKDKLAVIKEEAVSDEELAQKEHQEEKEIVEKATEMGLVEGDETEDFADETVQSTAEE